MWEKGLRVILDLSFRGQTNKEASTMCYVMCFLLDYFCEKLQEKLTLLFKTFLEMDVYGPVWGGWLDVVLCCDRAQGQPA